jgi:C-terminal processing protease CtpA/Prc
LFIEDYFKKVMKKLIILFVMVAFISGSCKKNEPVTNITVTAAEARDTLFYIMKQWYYWYDQSPATTITTDNKVSYSDPYTLLEAMRYTARDKWSFVADYDEFNAEMAGTFVGHGIRVGLSADSLARIAMIYNNSPLYASGVRRGWIVKTVGGVAIAPLIISKNTTAYDNAWGPSTSGYSNTIVFRKPNGKDTTITSVKSSFTINSVLVYDTLHLKTGAIAGHLVFESFIDPSEDELKTAFAYFKAQNVTKFILDLRYNGGGYLYIAQELAYYLAGSGLASTTFVKLSYNNKMQAANSTYTFYTNRISSGNLLSLPGVVVITSRLTASASEAVMNGLKPHLTVVSVGDTTDGKPVGMNGWPCGQKYWFWPITFKLVNSANQGEYFDGIAPDKIAIDDITHDFSDRNEKCLKEAIFYLETGAFSSGKGEEKFSRSVKFGEKPAWMNNTFVTDK